MQNQKSYSYARTAFVLFVYRAVPDVLYQDRSIAMRILLSTHANIKATICDGLTRSV